MESRKIKLMKLSQRTNGDTDAENNLRDTRGREKVGQIEKVALTCIHC